MLLVNDLTIQHLTDGPPGIIAESVSFSLKRGDSLGIVGESGSGKTITALSLLGLLPFGLSITSGHILYTTKNGEEIDLATLDKGDFRSIRGNTIAMVFQEPMSSLNPSMKCGDQIAEAVSLHLRINRKKPFRNPWNFLKRLICPQPICFSTSTLTNFQEDRDNG